MDDRERRLAFSREGAAEGTVTKRIELDDVDVESVHRRLRDRLDDADRFASFETDVRSDEPDRLEGRLSAVFGREAGDATIQYKPYGPHGAMAMLVGAVFAMPTLFASLVLGIVGYLLYRIERPAALPFERVTTVDVLVTGFTGETANPPRDPERADGPGTVEVVAAAEPGYAIDSDRAADLEWPHRKAILAQVRDWKGLALEDEPDRETIDDEFFSHLNMCWNRRATADVAAIDDAQRAVFADREGRRTYADLLRDRARRNATDEADRGADDEANRDADNADLDVDEDGGADATARLEELFDELQDGLAASERT